MMKNKKYALSHPQQRVLVSHLMYDNQPVCNIGGYVYFDQKIDIDRLSKSIECAIKKLDCFSIALNNCGGYVQVFQEKSPVIEYAYDEDGTECSLRNRAQNIIQTPFSLDDDNYYKIVVWEGKLCCGFVVVGHHMICDGWTFHLIAKTICLEYQNAEFKNNEFNNFSYKNYLETEKTYLNSQRAKVDQEYWRTFVEINVVGQKLKKKHSCVGKREEYVFSAEERGMLDKIENMGISVNTVLYSFFAIMSFKEFGTGVIGIPCYNRVGYKLKKTGGMFTSTMLSAPQFVAKPSDPHVLSELLMEYQNELGTVFKHQKWPLERMGISSNVEPFIFSVNCYNTIMNYEYEEGVIGVCNELYSGCQMIPCQIILNKWEENWKLQFDMLEEYFRNGESQKFIFYLREYMNAIVVGASLQEYYAQCDCKINAIQYQTENIAGVSDMTFYERILNVFEDGKGDQTLIITNHEMITRREFTAYVKGAVEVYKAYGLSEGDSVVLWMKNSLEYIVYLYACVAIGIRFIPTDVTTPEERVLFLFENSESKYIVSDKEKCFGAWIEPRLQMVSGSFKPRKIEEELQLYMLYTSGSTGVPKGVMISRGSMGAYLNWGESYYGRELSFYLHSSPSFDLSLTTVFLPITSNGRLVIDQMGAAPLYRVSESGLAQWVSAVKATPTQLALLTKGDIQKLKLKVIICGGEDFQMSLATELQDNLGDDCRIYNEYGPTECTIGCMCSKYNKGDTGKSVSIGIAAPGTKVYILDSHMNMCAPGEAGEMYLSGAQLAIGYWKLPTENMHHFIMSNDGKGRLYRTGDWARYNLDGKMDYLGRIGRQTKVNGYRIELDSIDNILKNIQGIHNAISWVEKGELDYLIAAVETDTLKEDEIREIIKRKVPRYFVPHIICVMQHIPVTVNGKVDIQTVQSEIRNSNALNFEKKIRLETVNESGPEILEHVLREVLSYSGPMSEFDFIMHGGDSIQAVQIIASLGLKGYKISLIDILSNPRFSDMCCLLKKKAKHEEKKAYPLPANLTYFAETCKDFNEYYHEIHVKVDSTKICVDLTVLQDKLLHVYPGLRCEYENGILNYDSKVSSNVSSLFSMIIESNAESIFLKLRFHHILVDGTAWIAILSTIHEILNGVTVHPHRLPENWMFDSKIIYNWEKNEVDSLYEGEEGVLNECKIVLEENIGKEYMDGSLFAEAVMRAIDNRKDNYTFLLDMDGRNILDVDDYNNIGCFSFLVPVTRGSTKIATTVTELQKTCEIKIPVGPKIRISYLGNFDKMLPEEMKLVETSLDISRINCSAWGCEFEFTAYNYNGKLNVIVGTRKNANVVMLKQICENVSETLSTIFPTDELDDFDLDNLEMF